MYVERTRPQPLPPSTGRPGLAPVRLLVLLALLVMPLLAPAGAQDDPALWRLDLGDLNPPYSAAGSFTTMTLSADGRVLAVGLDNGGALFLDAETGEELDAAHTADHGAMVRITLTADGGRAALVYDDGYLAVLDRGQEAPLLTMNMEPGGVAPDVRARVAAAMTSEGRFLMVTDDQVYLFMEEEANGTLRYRQVGISGEKVGPFIYVHPRLPFFGALSATGEVAIYSYGSSSLSLVGAQTLDLEEGESITAFGSSTDGSRFAIALSSGAFRRYLPQIGPNGGQLVLEYEDQILGRPRGIVLSGDGLRLVAWSVREAYWTEGSNRNVPEDEAAAAEAAVVRLKPPTFDQRFLSLDTSANLTRMLARFVGSSAETRLYNMPEQDHFVVAEETPAAAGPSAVDADGREVYRTEGTALQAYRITEKLLPPPALEEVDRAGGAPPTGENDEGDGFLGLDVSPTMALLAGGGLLLVVLLAVLVPLLLSSSRGNQPTLAPLAPDADSLSSLGDNVAAPPGVRRVAPSAPVAEAPPEGLLVLQDVAVHGGAALRGLSVAWRRPVVATVHGRTEELTTLTAGLCGRAPVTGTLAVGGASAAETPMLFSRRVQADLPVVADPAATPDAAYRAEAERHRLPGSLVARRIDSDLGWLGARRHEPLGGLSELDRWKLRLALALIHRPHVVLLPVARLPAGSARDERVAAAVGKVLRGVSRHFEVLVLLLDDGARPGAPLHHWSDETIRLAPNGFQDRTMLREGKPVRTRKPSNRGARGRRRTSGR